MQVMSGFMVGCIRIRVAIGKWCRGSRGLKLYLSAGLGTFEFNLV